MTKKKDIYQDITDKIIVALEIVSAEDYQAPFDGLAAQGLPLNPVIENRYHGINIPVLWVVQQEKGFASPHWVTFKQWQDKDACRAVVTANDNPVTRCLSWDICKVFRRSRLIDRTIREHKMRTRAGCLVEGRAGRGMKRLWMNGISGRR